VAFFGYVLISCCGIRSTASNKQISGVSLSDIAPAYGATLDNYRDTLSRPHEIDPFIFLVDYQRHSHSECGKLPLLSALCSGWFHTLSLSFYKRQSRPLHHLYRVLHHYLAMVIRQLQYGLSYFI